MSRDALNATDQGGVPSPRCRHSGNASGFHNPTISSANIALIGSRNLTQVYTNVIATVQLSSDSPWDAVVDLFTELNLLLGHFLPMNGVIGGAAILIEMAPIDVARGMLQEPSGNRRTRRNSASKSTLQGRPVGSDQVLNNLDSSFGPAIRGIRPNSIKFGNG